MSKDSKTKQPPNLVAAKQAAELLESAAYIVQAMKDGKAPTQFEVIGLATVILSDVFDQQVKQQQEETKEKEK